MIVPQCHPSQRRSVSEFTDWLVADDHPGVYLLNDGPRPEASPLMIRTSPMREVERIGALVGQRDLGQAVDASTDHARLVLSGE